MLFARQALVAGAVPVTVHGVLGAALPVHAPVAMTFAWPAAGAAVLGIGVEVDAARRFPGAARPTTHAFAPSRDTARRVGPAARPAVAAVVRVV